MKMQVKHPEVKTRFSFILLIVFFCLLSYTLQAQTIRYVKPSGGSGNGSSWATASGDLQAMINNSAVGDMIFVQSGTYQPGSMLMFALKEGVKIYGGFIGTETQLSQRDWVAHPTTLQPNGEVYIVYNYYLQLTSATLLDGFVITGATNSGLMNYSSSPTISNCTFSGNGMGINNYNSDPIISNCTFTNNTQGGAIFNTFNSDPVITNSSFTSNISPFNMGSGGGGGAVRNTGGSSAILTNCQFLANKAPAAEGGAIYTETGCALSLTNCEFLANTAKYAGAIYTYQSATTITNCLFQINKATSDAGAIFNGQSSLIITGSRFLGNYAANNGGVIVNQGHAPVINHCIFSGSSAVNYAVMENSGSNPVITNCLFFGNKAQLNGACIGNRASSTPVIANCTFSGNNSGNADGAIYNNTGGAAYIKNSIIWGNVGGINSAPASGTTTVTNSIIQGGFAGTGNMNVDPGFIDAPYYNLAPFQQGIYRLYECSPAINAGDNSSFPPSLTTDLAGKPRFTGAAIDMGVYEGGLTPGAGNIIYVNSLLPIGSSHGTGDSWANATSSLSAALVFAKQNQSMWTAANPLKIYIGIGHHWPRLRADNPCSAMNGNDRDNTFPLVSNVMIYGGFDPANGIDDLSDTRISGSNGTILRGDVGTFVNNSDNIYHLVSAAGVTNAVVDGCTISEGNANSTNTTTINGTTITNNDGGGVYCYSSAIALTNCIISGNQSSNFGGGVYTFNSPGTTLNNCTVTGNTSDYGGGVFNSSSSPAISGGSITNNRAGYGAGLFNHNTSSPVVQGTSFSGNQGTTFGGAVYNNAGSVARYTNCNFTGNSTIGSTVGGGGMFNNAASPVVNNCVFSGNSGDHGGAIYNYSTSSPVFNGCTFNNNTSNTFGGAFYNEPNSVSRINTSRFTGNSSQFGGAIFTYGSSKVVGCFFNGNTANSYGGAVYNSSASSNNSHYTNCVFAGNVAINPGGGGGAIFNNGSSTFTTNSTFYNNFATWGGAIHNWGNSFMFIYNNIIWGNSSSIQNEPGSSMEAFYNVIPGGINPNVNADPLYVNPASPIGADGIWGTMDDGLRVQPCSPALNVGSNINIFGYETDAGGAPRVLFTTVDIGAYEANSQANNNAANLVMANSSTAAWQHPSAKTYYATDCNTLIAAVTGDGSATTINRNTTAKLWIEPSPPAGFVRRHFEIYPNQMGAAGETATGLVTLYFTQGEFNDYNALNSIKLPQHPTDATGKANLVIEKKGIISSNGTGLPDSYSGTTAILNPDDANIVWNAVASRWEVSVVVPGFGGFFAMSQSPTLPLTLVSFTAKERECTTTLQWVTTDEVNVSHFEVQESNNGTSFTTISTTSAKNTGTENSYAVATPVTNDKTFYRLKMVDIDGRVKYSQVALITAACNGRILLYPVPAKDKLYLRNVSAGSTYIIYDNTGKAIRNGRITNPVHELHIEGIVPGIYYINLVDNAGDSKKLRFVKE